MARSGYERPNVEDRFGLFCSVIVSIIVVEIIRWLIHPSNYAGRWVGVIVSSVVLNIAYHIWSLPDTHAKTIFSAAYNQFTMPHVGALLWVFVLEITSDAVTLLRQLMPAPP